MISKSTIGRETMRAAWLQLPRACVPIYVAETRTGYTVGSYALCNLARSQIVMAGYFSRGVEFDAFAESVALAASEASKLESDAVRARRRRKVAA